MKYNPRVNRIYKALFQEVKDTFYRDEHRQIDLSDSLEERVELSASAYVNREHVIRTDRYNLARTRRAIKDAIAEALKRPVKK